MTSHAEMYTNGFPLNSESRWVPVGSVDESVEGIGKAVGFFSLPVEGVSKTVGNVGKSHWVFPSYLLKALRIAVGKIRPTR